ncbi:MAG: cation diffusion facilitator family transporter [Candidatus Omnitrophota bacterium]
MNIDNSKGKVSEELRTQQVRHVTIWGMFVNIALSGIKFVCGWIGHSQAVIADAIHSLSDLATDIAVLIGSRYWSLPADAEHPHGHGRIETVVTALLGFVLLAVGVGIGWNAIVTLQQRHEANLEAPKWIAFWAAVLSIVSKELLYHWTVKVGHSIKSQAVIANAWHHRSDGFSSIPAAISVAGAAISPDWIFLDHIGALIVCLFILQAAWSIMAPAFNQLIDAGASAKEIEQIETTALTVSGVKSVHAIRTRSIGSGTALDLHIQVDGSLTVQKGHEISGIVKKQLLIKCPDVVDVIIHIEPYRE